MRLILLDRSLFVYTSFGKMVKFQFLAYFSIAFPTGL